MLRKRVVTATLSVMETGLTIQEIIVYLKLLVAVLLLIVLYHALFIAVDLRKILRRIEGITHEVENMIMKPINLADHILEGIVKYLEEQGVTEGKKKKSRSKKK